jgi:hypothetical protein
MLSSNDGITRPNPGIAATEPQCGQVQRAERRHVFARSLSLTRCEMASYTPLALRRASSECVS